MWGTYHTRTLANAFPSYNDFETFYNGCGIPKMLKTTAPYNNCNLQAIYALLMSQYCDSHAASADPNKFKLSVMRKIYDYGPAFQREWTMQEAANALDIDDIETGGMGIHNHAQNPTTEPLTTSDEPLPYIDAQSVDIEKRGKIESIAMAQQAVMSGIAERFLANFDDLFIKVLIPYAPLLYETYEPEDD